MRILSFWEGGVVGPAWKARHPPGPGNPGAAGGTVTMATTALLVLDLAGTFAFALNGALPARVPFRPDRRPGRPSRPPTRHRRCRHSRHDHRARGRHDPRHLPGQSAS